MDHPAPVQVLVDILKRSFGERFRFTGKQVFEVVEQIIFRVVQYRGVQQRVVKTCGDQLRVMQRLGTSGWQPQ
jgi:hypothetical protein